MINFQIRKLLRQIVTVIGHTYQFYKMDGTEPIGRYESLTNYCQVTITNGFLQKTYMTHPLE